jgi:acetamidase/formamidase
MQRLPKDPLCYEFTRHAAPRATIASGESLLVESEDALSGQIRSAADRRDKSLVPFSNPVAGPIVVEGAEPGDALAVTIHDIRPTLGQCATYVASYGRLAEWLGSDCPYHSRVCPIRDGTIHFSDQVAIPYDPMLGCIGTAPAWGVPTTGPAGPHGGNLDLVEVRPGSTIHLPVFVPGGYLYLGDAHAAMGHAELSATGLEMPAETKITVNLVKQRGLAGPRIETPEELLAVATGCPMERSMAEALARLVLWLEADYGWQRSAAYDLLTHVARASIGHYAVGTVAVGVPRSYVVGRS